MRTCMLHTVSPTVHKIYVLTFVLSFRSQNISTATLFTVSIPTVLTSPFARWGEGYALSLNPCLCFVEHILHLIFNDLQCFLIFTVAFVITDSAIYFAFLDPFISILILIRPNPFQCAFL